MVRQAQRALTVPQAQPVLRRDRRSRSIAQGPQGTQGLTGTAGLMCWDLNGNGVGEFRRKILMAIMPLIYWIVPAKMA